MKILACTTVISLAAFSCLLPFSLGQADFYKLSIVENGTTFSEDIEVKQKKGIAVFRVPAHNDVDGADFYNDFMMRITVTKIPSRKVCYISELDSTLSSPGKLKRDLRKVVSQPPQRPVVVKRNLVMVTGPANRNVLTKEILDFCGALPIYKTKVFTDVHSENGTKARFQVDRQKRQTIKSFVSCGSFSALLKCPDAKWNLTCKMKAGTCYYWVDCVNQKPVKDEWKCQDRHIMNSFPSCCNLTCP